jgi:hypothetical protein
MPDIPVDVKITPDEKTFPTYPLCHKCKDGDIAMSWARSGDCAATPTTDHNWKYQCHTLNSEVDCPKFGGVGPAGASVAQPYIDKKDEWPTNKDYTCTYVPRRFFGNEDALKQWMKFRHPDSGWDDSLMTEYCAQSEQCLDAKDRDWQCPFLMTKALCNAWSETPGGKPYADALMNKWCKDRIKVREDGTIAEMPPACECLYREYEPHYQKINRMLAADMNDGCWYMPCKDSTNRRRYVPSHLRHPDCPEKLCQILVEVSDSNGIDISDNKFYQDCSDYKPDEESKIKEILLMAGLAFGGAVALGGIGLLVYSILK